MYELALITSLRSENSVKSSINSLRESGFNEKIYIFVDCVSNQLSVEILSQFTNIQIFSSKSKLGMVENTRIAWEYLYKNTNAPWLIVCEDDILCQPCLFKVLQDVCKSIKRQIGYVSCYTPLIYSQMADYTFSTFGWKKLNMGMHTWGTQFFAIQRETCKLILEKWSLFFSNEKLQDRIIGEILQDLRLDCFYPFPSLVNHLGLMNSTHMKAPLIGNTAWIYGLNVHEQVLKNFDAFL